MPALSAANPRVVGVAWAAVLVLCLVGLAALVNLGLLHSADSLLLSAAQVPGGAVMDWLMGALSLTGTAEVTSLLLLVFVLTGEARSVRDRFSPLAVFLLLTASEVVGKFLVRQPGPPLSLLRGPHLHLLSMVTAYSFPSGHMVRATMVFGLYGLRLHRHRGNAAWLWASIAAVWVLGYSRVYLAEHWPADVAGGILLGGAGLALCLVVSRRGTAEAGAGDPR